MGYIERWREEDLAKLDPPVRQALSLRCASNSQIHKWRKLQLCRQLQRRPFDTGSSAVQSKRDFPCGGTGTDSVQMSKLFNKVKSRVLKSSITY